MRKNSNSSLGFRKLRPTTQKILLLLMGGVALGLTKSPKQYFRIIKGVQKNWEWVNHYALKRAIKNLYRSKLLDAIDNPDETTTLILTELGKKHALTYKIDEITIPRMKKWDRKWRIIIFDIPEKFKKSRDALSRSLKRMGFYQLQKSVLVHPFECGKEIDFMVEFFNIHKFVRRILAENIDNELDIKTKFNL